MIKKILLASFIAITLVAWPLMAFAHATPTNYQPPASSANETAPKEIRITFSERIEPSASSIRVFNQNNTNIVNTRATADKNDRHVLIVPIQDTGNGNYTVSWEVVSADDGHFTKGGYSFSVGNNTNTAEIPPSNFSIEHKSSLPEGLTTGIELLGTALLLGALIVAIFIMRLIKPDDTASIEQKLKRVVLTGTIFIILGGLAFLLIKSYALESIRIESGLLTALKIISQTSIGIATIAHISIAIIFACLFWTLPKNKNPKTIILFILVISLHAIRSIVSHAAASHFYPTLSVTINFIHVLFKDLWIGTLIAFAYSMSQWFTKTTLLQIKQLLLVRMSQIAGIAIAIAGLSGSYVVWLHLKTFNNILTTDWGKRFVTLSILGGILLGFRLFHYFFVDRSFLKPVSPKIKTLLEKLPLTYSLELFTGIGVLLVTGFLIITTPPTQDPARFMQTINTENGAIEISQDQYRDSSILIAFTEKNNTPAAINNTVITLEQKSLGTGPIVVEAEQIAANEFIFDKKVLSANGTWTVNITGQNPGQYDLTGSLEITYPKAFTNAPNQPNPPFTLTVFGIGLFSFIFGIYVFHDAKKTETAIRTINENNNQLPNLQIKEKGSWPLAAFALGAFFYTFGGIHPGHSIAITGNFERECIKNGHMWHTSVPMLRGVALSSRAIPGCMAGHTSPSHFASKAQYNYFIRPVESIVTMDTAPANPTTAQPTNLHFKIIEGTGNETTDLTPEHERLMHVIIMHQDGTIFDHIHPTKIKNTASQFTVPYTFKKPGKYIVAADYTIRNTNFSEKFYVTVMGPDKTAPQDQLPKLNELTQTIGDYTVLLKIEQPIKAKNKIYSRLNITYKGKPVTDLAPYLGTPAHIAIIRTDLLQFVHTHGTIPQTLWQALSDTHPTTQHLIIPNKFGPEILLELVFPTPGQYHIFTEFKHNNKIITAHFIDDIK